MTEFTKRAIKIIQSIPAGYVMTYGQVARLAGNHRAARIIVYILKNSSKKHNLPWHRVINREGTIVIKDEESNFLQRVLLEEEGVEVSDEGKVDLKKYQCTGSTDVEFEFDGI